MRRALVTLGVAAVIAAAGCREKKKDELGEEVIASVNGELVSKPEFARELGRSLEGDETALEQIEPIKRSLLQTLVDKTLLLQQARELGVAATEAEVDREVLRASADYPAGGFDAELARRQLTMAEFKQKEAARLTIEKLFGAHVYPRVGYTEEEIRRYFEEHTQDFQQPEEVRAAQIVVKAIDEARRIQQQLQAGKKFAELARKYSLSADAKVGGDLGFFPRGMMPPRFDDVAFSLGVGRISDIVETEYGFHLFKILERRPARKRELAEVRGEVEKKLLAQKREQAQEDFLAALREKATIKVNEPVLLAVVTRAGAPAEAKE